MYTCGKPLQSQFAAVCGSCRQEKKKRRSASSESAERSREHGCRVSHGVLLLERFPRLVMFHVVSHCICHFICPFQGALVATQHDNVNDQDHLRPSKGSHAHVFLLNSNPHWHMLQRHVCLCRKSKCSSTPLIRHPYFDVARPGKLFAIRAVLLWVFWQWIWFVTAGAVLLLWLWLWLWLWWWWWWWWQYHWWKFLFCMMACRLSDTDPDR